MKYLISLILSLFILSPVYAERVKVCAQYQRMDLSWSKEYAVTGYKLKGNELKETLKDNYKHYIYDYGEYFIIHWRNGEYTYYKVGTGFPFMTETVFDQNGRKWKVRSRTGMCA